MSLRSVEHSHFALCTQVLVPYIKTKLDRLFQQLLVKQQEAAWHLSAPEKLFLRLYRYFHACFEGAFVLFQLGYLFDLTPCYTPVLRLLGQKLVRASDDPTRLKLPQVQ